MSQVGETEITSTTDSTNATSSAMRAKQTLMNEQLRDEMANLRQVVERLQAERHLAVGEEAPPLYSRGF